MKSEQRSVEGVGGVLSSLREQDQSHGKLRCIYSANSRIFWCALNRITAYEFALYNIHVADVSSHPPSLQSWD